LFRNGDGGNSLAQMRAIPARIRFPPALLERMPMSEVLKDGRPRIAITYCTQCNWLLRSAWMAQELLHTFGPDLGEVALAAGQRRQLPDPL
jgi:hypothetical protein